MGLTMSQWDDLPEYDRAWAFGLDILDAEEKVGRCAACGGPADVCQDTDNQHAYVVSVRRCFRTRALQEEQRKPRWKNDPDAGSLLWTVTLDPTRKKSARQEVARG